MGVLVEAVFEMAVVTVFEWVFEMVFEMVFVSVVME
jgi:hypothetical protein